MMKSPLIFVVDDDEAYRESISVLIESFGWKTKCFASAQEYLDQFDPEAAGCLILDVRMPGMGGLRLQEELNALPICPAIIILTGHAEVPIALRAMRQGAADFLEKTFSESELYEAIQRALSKDRISRQKYERMKNLTEAFGQLSSPERDVLRFVLQGEVNKRIAVLLGISQRTVEDRRARIMQKVDAKSLADLVRLAIEAGLSDST